MKNLKTFNKTNGRSRRRPPARGKTNLQIKEVSWLINQTNSPAANVFSANCHFLHAAAAVKASLLLLSTACRPPRCLCIQHDLEYASEGREARRRRVREEIKRSTPDLYSRLKSWDLNLQLRLLSARIHFLSSLFQFYSHFKQNYQNLVAASLMWTSVVFLVFLGNFVEQ